MLRPRSRFFFLFLLGALGMQMPFAAMSDSLPPRLELSFGESQLFIRTSERMDLSKTEASVLPTSAALLLGEWFATKHWHAMMLFNLPVGTQKFVLDSGGVVEERLSPYLGFGPLWEPCRWTVASGRVSLAPQFTGIAGILFREHGQWMPAPVLGSRFHMASPDGFTMYLGGSWTVGVSAFSLLYGVGHRF